VQRPEERAGVVLVVEDDVAVRAVFRAVLAYNGFTVEAAETADDAIAACKRRRGAIDLLIADVRLPSRSGTDVAVALSRCYPRVPILFTSGTDIEFWSDADHANLGELPRESFAFLPKPFTCWTLMQKVGELLSPFTLPHTA
jgi:DNA-binding NtrC family response regulator